MKLEWQTAGKLSNNGFVIYRGGDDGIFVKIGDVQANDYSPISYAFYDNVPLNGNNYYKLVQVDVDGKQTDLGVKSLAFNFQPSTFNLYPNPADDSVTVSFEAGRFTRMEITDLNGRILQHIGLSEKEDSKIISLGTYPAGIYIMRLSGKGNNESRKVIRK